jgi:hypothetical protein
MWVSWQLEAECSSFGFPYEEKLCLWGPLLLGATPIYALRSWVRPCRSSELSALKQNADKLRIGTGLIAIGRGMG